MDTPQPPRPPLTAQPWQRLPVTQLLAAIAGVAPLYTLSILSGVQTLITGAQPQLELWSSLLGTLLYVGVFGAWAASLLWLACGESLAGLQLKPGRLGQDVLSGTALGVVLLLAMACFHQATALFTPVEIPDTNRVIADQLAGNPWLFLVWAGPVVWLQAALLEEGYRVFLLSRLWRVWPSPAGKLLALAGSSLLFGLGHAYQGPQGMLGTALIGGLLGAHYLRRGRVLPLIIAHGVYDTVVLAGLVIYAKSGWL